jgi:hypothetical protein
LAELKTLSPAGQDAMSAWRTGAQRRLEVDRRVAAIRAVSLANLVRAAGEPTAP